jgi:YidC/Oxa1 family membrane protein insertase
MKKNYILAISLSISILVLWQWLVTGPQSRRAAAARPDASPSAASSATPSVAAGGSVAPTSGIPVAPPAVERDIVYEAGDLRVTFNTAGAGLRRWENGRDADRLALRPGTEGETLPLTTFPDILFTSRQDGRIVTFRGQRADGLLVVKTFELNDGPIQTLRLQLENKSKAPLSAVSDLGWGAGVLAGDDHRKPKEAAEGQRAIAFDGEKLTKLSVGENTGNYRWWAVDGLYFLAAFLNDGSDALVLQTRKDKPTSFWTVHRRIQRTLAPGETATLEQKFYLGPKSYDGLKSLGLSLERSVDFGYFAPIGKIIHQALFIIHKSTGNYGWAIILLTLLIQLLMLPLTVKSFNHSQKLKAVQPQLKRIQELYKSDPRRLQVEMMAVYQKHGLRFMGMEGCFPVLLQLPIFWALYSTLRNTFELRHAPWIAWVKDLSVHDPFFVLPILMGAGMFGQQKLTSAAVDPAQAQIMYLMPAIFTFVFLKMPSGLVIYWLTNSVVTIVVQLILLQRQKKAAVR